MPLRVRIRYNHFIPRFLRVRGIVLYPFVLFSDSKETLPTTILQHEFIHVRQVRREGFIKFYLVYLMEYARHLAREKNHYRAYNAIKFEKEAYQNEAQMKLSNSELAELGERAKTEA